MEIAFKVKQKTFFLVLQVLSIRQTKQTSKNVADTTFKEALHCQVGQISKQNKDA